VFFPFNSLASCSNVLSKHQNLLPVPFDFDQPIAFKSLNTDKRTSGNTQLRSRGADPFIKIVSGDGREQTIKP
jgi:hypothetical protein